MVNSSHIQKLKFPRVGCTHQFMPLSYRKSLKKAMGKVRPAQPFPLFPREGNRKKRHGPGRDRAFSENTPHSFSGMGWPLRLMHRRSQFIRR